MKQVLIRALPFLMTFVLGVAVAAIFGAVLPRYHVRNHTCSKKYTATVRMGSVSPPQSTVGITQIRYSGETTRSEFSGGNYLVSPVEEEDMLYFTAMYRPGCCSNSDRVVSYISPRAVDGGPVTSDAVLTNVPRPRFWADERRVARVQGCNAMIRLDLQASGTIAFAEKVQRYTESCQYIDDIFDAARNISFQPALRNGVPVDSQIAILYTVR